MGEIVSQLNDKFVLKYAELEFVAFPCVGKTPCRGISYPGLSSSEGVALFEKHVDTNIGVVVPVGVIVIDLDIKNGNNGIRTIQAIQANFNPANYGGPLARSGSGGYHLWFRQNPNHRIGCKTDILPGVDTKAEGKGYVIVAPSVHPDSGKEYKWIHPLVPIEEMPMIPNWLKDALEPNPPKKQLEKPVPVEKATKSTKARTAPKDTCHSRELPKWLSTLLERYAREVSEAAQGSRNNTLNLKAYTLAGVFAFHGCSVEIIRQRLGDAAREVGLSVNEVEATLKSAIANGASRPIDFAQKSSVDEFPLDDIHKLAKCQDAQSLCLLVYHTARGGKSICSLYYRDWGIKSRGKFERAQAIVEKYTDIVFERVPRKYTNAYLPSHPDYEKVKCMKISDMCGDTSKQTGAISDVKASKQPSSKGHTNKGDNCRGELNNTQANESLTLTPDVHNIPMSSFLAVVSSDIGNRRYQGLVTNGPNVRQRSEVNAHE
jgi:hypothetical protein